MASSGDSLSLKVVDSQNAAIGTLATTQYVTLTITGPGSFTAVTSSATAATTTTTVQVSGNGTYSGTLQVFPLQGQTGQITVTATNSGLTSASATINSVNPGVASTYTVTPTTGTLTAAQATTVGNGTFAGQSYTAYTVQFTDASGNQVNAPANDILTLTDNSQSGTSNNGTLVYMTYDSTQTSPVTGYIGTSTSGSSTTITTNFGGTPSTGKYQFAVVNTATGATSPTLTTTDSVLNLKQTQTYTYVTGSAAKVTVPTAEKPSYEFALAPSGTTNITFQIADAAGNAVKLAGQTVDVWFDGSTAPSHVTLGTGSYTPTGSVSATIPTNAYQVTTDANGVATVAVAAASTATMGTGITVDAALAGQTTSSVNAVQISGEVVTVAGAVNSLALTTVTPSANNVPGSTITVPTNMTLAAGSTMAAATFGTTGTVNVVGLNAIGQAEPGNADTIQVSTSNSSILSITGATNGVLPIYLDGTNGYIVLPTITGLQAGTATITLKDVSATAQPSMTFSVTVQPSTPLSTASAQINGQAISSKNQLTVVANTPVTLTIANVDGGQCGSCNF